MQNPREHSAILSTFISHHLSFRPLFRLFLSDRLRQVLLWLYIFSQKTYTDPEGGGTGGPDPPLPPGKIQVAIGFLRNTGTDLPREAIGQIHTSQLAHISGPPTARKRYAN